MNDNNATHLTELPKAYNPHEVEDRIYKKWEDGKYFHSVPGTGKRPYSIVIPPPNITGILHMGHALNNTIQDILVRFKRMQGFAAEWMPGTDHAGIATQNVVERKLAKEGVKRQDLGRDKFVGEVWKWRDEYGSTIIKQLKKLGCSCDWDRTRFTMDEGLSEAVLEVFIRLYEKGLIYRGNYIINWCPRCQTALSDEESQHKDIEGMLYYIKYPVSVNRQSSAVDRKNKKTKDDKRSTINDERGSEDYIIVATTRPETMLGDVAVAVNPKDKRYKNIHGKTVMLPILNRELAVICDPLVDMKFGTGALKITPAHDPVDFQLGLKYGLEQINVMNDDATINTIGADYEGMDRLEAREAIIADLKERGLFIKSEPHRHAVGHCYRCHTMIEPRLSPQWFVSMKPLSIPAIKAVKDKKIKFYPERWTKVYLDWMHNIRDWCISRQIWWGHRIPVYYCKKCMESGIQNQRSKIKDQKEDTRQATRNAQCGTIVSKTKPEKCPTCGSTELEQDPDVLDTWFSSWLWPFSTFGWPAKTPELGYFYPTDSLVTAQEIIFFWVARMIMAGMEFMGDIPFKNVYIHGTVRDITGTKMSKSLGNVIDPLDMIKKYGTDALRFSIISITAQGQDVFLSENKFELGRNFANKLWNASRFILMNQKPSEVNADLCVLYKEKELALAERWVLSRFYSTLAYVQECLDQFKFNEAANAIYEFVWHEFCDWYIEIAKSTMDDKTSQIILYKMLEKSLRMLHPFMPFITEEIWQRLPKEKGRPADSIMLQPWPHLQQRMISKKAEEDMSLIIDIITSIRNIRSVWNIEPQREIEVLVNTSYAEHDKLFTSNIEIIKRLARISNMKIGKLAKPASSAVSVVKDIEVFVPLEGLIDFSKERTRLEKEESRIELAIQSLASRLRDKNFLSKAPEDVVEKQRAQKEEYQAQLKKIKENLKELKHSK
ncbi:MAG TPA: valine--tRNA ligase [Candidatus Omnitrophota bacterium]|nr:valine--tRNA ligase [Candidatus Omnitrophota bacterium]